METYATIGDNEHEGYDSVVFKGDKLIFPEPTPYKELSLRQAQAFLQKYYPGAEVVSSYKELEKVMKEHGYKPHGTQSTYTDMLCNLCGGAIKIDKNSVNAGVNAPYSALVNKFYHCVQCEAKYDRQSQERQYGTSYEWSMRAPGASTFVECGEPEHIKPENPYGFREEILVKM